MSAPVPLLHPRATLLRFLTCGSVDDGKSTLIGRLLCDSGAIPQDQIEALKADARKAGGADGSLDFSLLTDGLAAEREQGITIDVAYRFFATAKRKFIVADTPGHEQYTRNMATGASTADLAIILVDARKGVLTQTRRHAFLVSLLGISNVVLAVNKMDLVGWRREIFDAIVADYRAFAAKIKAGPFKPIPLSGRLGDNILAPSANTPWYDGPSLLGYLETVEIEEDRQRHGAFRLPVQWVNRPHQDFRGFAGTIVSGAVSVGEAVRVAPSGRTSTIARIVTRDGDLERAAAGQAVTLTLTDEIDVSRGDVIALAQAAPEVADQFEAHLIWMHEDELLPGRSYLLKIGPKLVAAQITAIKHKIDIDTLEEKPARTFSLNDIGVCAISLDQGVAFDPYTVNKDMGGFILIDRMTNATVGAGLIRSALRRARNVHWQALEVTPAARAALKGQSPAVLWFTGLSGAGKSTIANLVEKKLHAQGRHTFVLDGDNLRHGLNRDLGFTDADRVENLRRAAEIAKLMAEAGLIVIVSFISPFRAERAAARARIAPTPFLEVFIDTPLAEVERRDVKGLYKQARAGTLRNVTGLDSPYEAPEAPEIHIETSALTPLEAAERIVSRLTGEGEAGDWSV